MFEKLVAAGAVLIGAALAAIGWYYAIAAIFRWAVTS